MEDNRFFCDYCGTEVSAHADVCPECGRAFGLVTCPRCGHEGEPRRFAKGCPKCGYLAVGSEFAARGSKGQGAGWLNSGTAPIVIGVLVLLFVGLVSVLVFAL